MNVCYFLVSAQFHLMVLLSWWYPFSYFGTCRNELWGTDVWSCSHFLFRGFLMQWSWEFNGFLKEMLGKGLLLVCNLIAFNQRKLSLFLHLCSFMFKCSIWYLKSKILNAFRLPHYIVRTGKFDLLRYHVTLLQFSYFSYIFKFYLIFASP